MLFKRDSKTTINKSDYIRISNQQSEKATYRVTRKYLQAIYLLRGQYIKYIRNFYDSTAIAITITCLKYGLRN